MKLGYRTWMGENAAVMGALACVLAEVGVTQATLGWALVVLGAHTANSHALRLRERDGRGPDWLAEGAKWVVVLGTALQQPTPTRWLTLVGLAGAVYFTAWRCVYRWAKPTQPNQWGL